MAWRFKDHSGMERRPYNHSFGPDEEKEKISALESGADDYVTKPFGVASLSPGCT